MDNANYLKNIVKEKYSEIAKSSENSTCGGINKGCKTDSNGYKVFQDDYSGLEGYFPDADLGLGCGLPIEFAGIKKGDTVVDLGSGAGNDVFVARSVLGETGKVIGLDFTENMIEKAKNNNIKLGYKNIEFKLGDIEYIPLEDNTADVVVSNCVLNLVPDKFRVFSEINRILKPKAHFCVSDVVIKGRMTEELRQSAELYAGCISGALNQDEYLDIIKSTNFKNISIKKHKKIDLPEDFLKNHLSQEGLQEYRRNLSGIFSITVIGYKI